MKIYTVNEFSFYNNDVLIYHTCTKAFTNLYDVEKFKINVRREEECNGFNYISSTNEHGIDKTTFKKTDITHVYKIIEMYL